MKFNDSFDNIYVISLEKRDDRRRMVVDQMKSVGCNFEFYNATDGDLIDKSIDLINNIEGWNHNALALSMTTVKVLEDAKIKGYKSILIMEDDVKFSNDFNEYMKEVFLPDENSWDMFFFGYLERKRSFPISLRVSRLKSAFCCHCYAVNSSVYQDYIDLIKRYDMPIDWVTSEYFQPLGRCYGTRKSVAHQKPDYSNIRKKKVFNKVT